MAIFLALLFLALVFSRIARVIVALIASVLGLYLVWDNLYTETDAGPGVIEVRKAEASLIGAPAISVPVRIELQITNHAAAELESIDVVVTLLDCREPVDQACEPVGKKVVRLQLLAPSGKSRRTDGSVHFENVPST